MKIDCRKYGMLPFWFWNGKQNKPEISRQLELAAREGLRGMAIHGRKGNRIEYMSEQWIELVRHACEKAEELGLEIWLYDEDGCPSGTVGLRLPSRGEKFQQKALNFTYTAAANAAGDCNLIKAFATDNLTIPVDPAKLPGETKVLAFSRFLISDYIDALDRNVLDEFLHMTHEIYWRGLKEFFGRTITGIYTDDLNHLLIYGEDIPYLSYTDALEKNFKEQCGYSILDNLPHLVENLPGCEKIRFDYRQTVMRMFLNNFVAPMREWSELHGLPLTGHLSGDEGSMLISICRFSAAMPFYEYEDIPGIDDFLTAREDNYYLREAFNHLGFSIIILCKQASSVANQLKNALCSSEVLTSRGWGVPVKQQVMQIRVQQGLGINILVPHAFSYSTLEVAKRDHPASYFFQQPWYGESRIWQDAISRSSCLISRGICAADTAILNPVTSGWITLDGERQAKGFSCLHPGTLPEASYLETKFAELSLSLLQQHIDFEYADEELLAKHGSVTGGKLVMGNAAYSSLLLPPLVNLRQTTIKLLKEFSRAGGKIIQFGDKARFVDGISSQDIYSFDCIYHDNPEAIKTELSPLLDFAVINGQTKDILLHTRSMTEKLEYYLLNCSDESQTLYIRNNMSGYILFDPQNDCIVTDNGNFPSRFALPPAACCHILPDGVLNPGTTVNISDTLFSPQLEDLHNALPVDFTIKIEPENNNVLMLDYGFTPQGEKILFSNSQDISAWTVIAIPVDIPSPDEIVYLYAEMLEKSDIFVNGKKLTWDGSCHPASNDLQRASLNGILHPGINTIQVNTAGKRLEMLYLAGRFGVQLNSDPKSSTAKIIAGTPLQTGDVAQQGMPFYWGSIKYEIEFTIDETPEKLRLDLGRVEGVVRVMVNGKNTGTGYGPPYLFNLKNFLQSGSNRIEIKLFNTAQNFLGPHRAENIMGSNRAFEGSAISAWTPPIDQPYPDSWGIAPFGIYGPVSLRKIT